MECEMFLDLRLPSFLSSSLEMNYLAAGLRASTFSGTFSDILIHFYQKMNENGKNEVSWLNPASVLFIMKGERERKRKVRRKSGKLVERQDPSFHKYRLKNQSKNEQKVPFRWMVKWLPLE